MNIDKYQVVDGWNSYIFKTLEEAILSITKIAQAGAEHIQLFRLYN